MPASPPAGAGAPRPEARAPDACIALPRVVQMPDGRTLEFGTFIGRFGQSCAFRGVLRSPESEPSSVFAKVPVPWPPGSTPPTRDQSDAVQKALDGICEDLRREFAAHRRVLEFVRAKPREQRHFPEWSLLCEFDWEVGRVVGLLPGAAPPAPAAGAGDAPRVRVPLLVYQLVEGPSLDEWVRSRPHGVVAESREFLELARQIARALDDMHSLGLRHADIHPWNVLVSSVDAPACGFRVVLVDFGLATDVRSVGAPTRRAGMRGFIAPEVLHQEHADERSDIWSLGAVLFRALTGREPDVGRHEWYREACAGGASSADGGLDRHKRLVGLDLVAAGNPVVHENPAVVDLVVRCLRPNRSQRTRSAGDLLKEIALCDPVEAPSEPEPQSSLDAIRRSFEILREASDGTDLLAEIARVHLQDVAALLRRLARRQHIVQGDHETLVHDMCKLLRLLGLRDRYITTSFAVLWSEENLGTQGRYLTQNTMAAARGVDLRRVLIVDRREYDTPGSLTERVVAAHRAAVLLARSLPAAHPRNVQIAPESRLETRVRFVDGDELARLMRESHNMALWQSGDTNVAIIPSYVGDRIVAMRFLQVHDPSPYLELYALHAEHAVAIDRVF